VLIREEPVKWPALKKAVKAASNSKLRKPEEMAKLCPEMPSEGSYLQAQQTLKAE